MERPEHEKKYINDLILFMVKHESSEQIQLEWFKWKKVFQLRETKRMERIPCVFGVSQH